MRLFSRRQDFGPAVFTYLGSYIRNVLKAKGPDERF
jgi:hypothetical protein